VVILRPNQVAFGTAVWPRVERVTIDRLAARTVREWSDDGPNLVFADVPERLVRARVWQSLDQTTLGAPLPGALAEVRIELSPGADEGRRLVRFDAVVESVTHEVSQSRTVRVISLLAVSDAGDEDPITITDAS